MGWTDEQSEKFQSQAEAAFELWSAEADARNRLPFWAMQTAACYSLLVKGEFFRQPVMLDDSDFNDSGRNFSLAVQSIDPSRVFTPSDISFFSPCSASSASNTSSTNRNASCSIRDGIAIGRRGEPSGYWISNPLPETGRLASNAKDFSFVPAKIAHRPGMLHGLIVKDDDQYRGVSVLAPAMKFFRDLSDYLDFELAELS